MKYPDKYCVFDFETTGLDPETCKILEIGAMRVNGDLVERYSAIINWKEPVPAKITEITGIDDALVEKEGKDPDVVREEFKAFIKGSLPLIGHNIYNFDLKFLVKFFSLEEKAQKALTAQFIDTATICKAQKLNEDRHWNESMHAFSERIMSIRAYGVHYNLGLMCDELGISKEGIVQHRAAGDVELTNMLYRKLLLTNEKQS